MTDLEQQILAQKIATIKKYIGLGRFPLDFVWHEDEYKDQPYRARLLDWFKCNTKFERTQHGIAVHENLYPNSVEYTTDV